MQNEHLRIFGYGTVVPSGQSARVQKNRFEKYGIDRVFIDPSKDSTEEFDWLLQPGDLGLQPGETLMLVCEAYLGYPGTARRSRLKRLTDRGVLVGVLGEEPVLYDDEDRVKAFLTFAKTGAMKDRGKAAAKAMGPGPGKPAKAALTQHQWEAACHFWQYSRVDRFSIVSYIQTCSAKNGKVCEVTNDNLFDWLGKREPGDRKPPAGLIIGGGSTDGGL